MRCPYCDSLEDKVVDSRSSKEGSAIRRRRECLSCGRRFTTYEYIEDTPLTIIKSDGRREPFDKNKLFTKIQLACTKRPISTSQIEDVVDRIEAELIGRGEREVAANPVVGEAVMRELKMLDDVAYVRFASVYRQFKDIRDFERELRELEATHRGRETPPVPGP
jgi:transcriptional repressor NrdR